MLYDDVLNYLFKFLEFNNDIGPILLCNKYLLEKVYQYTKGKHLVFRDYKCFSCLRNITDDELKPYNCGCNSKYKYCSIKCLYNKHIFCFSKMKHLTNFQNNDNIITWKSEYSLFDLPIRDSMKDLKYYIFSCIRISKYVKYFITPISIKCYDWKDVCEISVLKITPIGKKIFFTKEFYRLSNQIMSFDDKNMFVLIKNLKKFLDLSIENLVYIE